MGVRRVWPAGPGPWTIPSGEGVARMNPDNQPRAESILIVDDDVRVVELLQITLSGRGYQVVTAYDGGAALEAIARNAPDLVVLDSRLPVKSGFEVLDTIRRDPARRHLPVVIISADAATESRLQGLRLGADDYLVKPFSPRELIIKIRRILDRSQDRQLLLLKTEVLEGEIRRSRDTLLQMRQEMGQSLNRMSAMLSQVVELNRFRSIEEILDRFVLTTVANLDFQQVALLLPGEDGTLRPRVCRGIDETAARGLVLAGDGPSVRFCVAAGRPVRVDELAEEPDASDEILRVAAAGGLLLVPALQHGRVCGLLVLGDRMTGDPLGRFDYKLLEILGTSIVAAVQNARSFEETQRSFLETTAQLIATIEDRYPYLRGHSERVTEISLAIGRPFGLSPDEIESLRFGALLHDLGQLDQYRELLDQAVVLSPSDRRLHRRRAAEQVAHLLGPGGNGAVGEIVRHHQEYWDGSGLPDNLRDTEIPFGARVVAVANAWDALVHDRPHRPAYATEEALRILRDRAGRQFDPDLVEALARVVAPAPAGACSAGSPVAG